ncbi:increased DNA methylation 3-like [Bidens hawaiensis]|uniref:increased DNA methylation 3-like n=1 Tax=Bidens hawaiensis TaxID=980011 RepID=UPI00404AA8F1
MGFEVLPDNFVSLPKPEYVTLFGAEENAPGPLANVAELEANNHHYRVLVELSQVRFYEHEVEWTVSCDGEVTIEGQVTPASIYADNRLIGSRRNRIQLCPTEPWGISFFLPCPVDSRTTQVTFRTQNLLEILVMKDIPEADASADGLPPLADTGPGQGLGPGPDDDLPLVAGMVDGRLE